MRLRRLRLIVLLVIVAVPPAFADFRCQPSGKIVSPGMTSYQVEVACGSPVTKTINTVSQQQAPRHESETVTTTVTTQVETWTYDFGPNRLIKIFHFENGILVKNESTNQYGVKR